MALRQSVPLLLLNSETGLPEDCSVVARITAGDAICGVGGRGGILVGWRGGCLGRVGGHGDHGGSHRGDYRWRSHEELCGRWSSILGPEMTWHAM